MILNCTKSKFDQTKNLMSLMVALKLVAAAKSTDAMEEIVLKMAEYETIAFFATEEGTKDIKTSDGEIIVNAVF